MHTRPFPPPVARPLPRKVRLLRVTCSPFTLSKFARSINNYTPFPVPSLFHFPISSFPVHSLCSCSVSCSSPMSYSPVHVPFLSHSHSPISLVRSPSRSAFFGPISFVRCSSPSFSRVSHSRVLSPLSLSLFSSFSCFSSRSVLACSVPSPSSRPVYFPVPLPRTL